MEQTENLGGGARAPGTPPPVPMPMDMEVTSQEWVMKIQHLFVYGPSTTSITCLWMGAIIKKNRAKGNCN